jgi:hypothetical protein
MAVDPAHAGHFVPHPFRLENVCDAVLVHPGLVAVPQAVRGQAGKHRQPRRQGKVRGGRLSRSFAAASARPVRYDAPVQSPRPCATADGTPASRGVTDQADNAAADRWLEFLAGHRRKPWRHQSAAGASMCEMGVRRPGALA